MSAEPVLQHPLLAAVHAARAALSEVAETQPVYVAPGTRKAALLQLAALKAQAEELELRVLAASEDLAQQAGARDAGLWLAAQTRIDPRTGRNEINLAHALDQRWVLVGAAMRTGDLNRAQAQVITTALDKLPAEIDQLTRRRAEKHLIELAAQFVPRELRILGDRILEVVAPEIADEVDAKALEREERRTRLVTSLRVRQHPDGSESATIRAGKGLIARLLTVLDPFTSPRQDNEPRPRHRKLGEAFCALLERLDPDKLPDHGVDATTVIVTIGHEALTKRLATATMTGSLDGDLRISGGEARRLACNAKILPAVLNGKSEILDLGRAKRLFSPAQRKAMRLRDKACKAEGCSIPARWCEAHHRDPWSLGGNTDLADGVLLCSFHHHRAHDTRYLHELLPSGDWRFHRRT